MEYYCFIFWDTSVCCSAKFVAFFDRNSLIDGKNSLISKSSNLYVFIFYLFKPVNYYVVIFSLIQLEFLNDFFVDFVQY